MSKKKHERLCGCGRCPCLWGVEVDVFRHLSSPASCGRDTSSPLGLQPQHSKPPSWMYLFETSIFKTWRFSVIKQNVLKINQCLYSALFRHQSAGSVWCMHVCVGGWECVCLCAFEHTKQMLCSNEVAERLSWISWVAAYQDGVLLLSPCSKCGLTSRKRQALWVTV